MLVTTLTKKMSEDLTDYLLESGVKARYLHSEIDTLERIQIVRDLRLGEFDVLVGVNLLREGLDLPGGVARRDPRRRQGGLPPRPDVPDPDDRPRGAEHQRQGAHVRRQGDGGDQGGARRDEPPPRRPARVQRGARDRADHDPEGRLRHRRAVPARGADTSRAAAARRVEGRGHVARGAREARRHARGRDVRRRRRAPVRVRGQAPRRDQGAPARAPGARPRPSARSSCG